MGRYGSPWDATGTNRPSPDFKREPRLVERCRLAGAYPTAETAPLPDSPATRGLGLPWARRRAAESCIRCPYAHARAAVGHRRGRKLLRASASLPFQVIADFVPCRMVYIPLLDAVALEVEFACQVF